jgi:hypothetical protein
MFANDVQLLCATCNQPLYGEPDVAPDGLITALLVHRCCICQEKALAVLYRRFIAELPNSLLAAARTLESSDAPKTT